MRRKPRGGVGANTSARITFIRAVVSRAMETAGRFHLPKEGGYAPAPITLARVRLLERPLEEEQR